jgi:hypothetical protein
LRPTKGNKRARKPFLFGAGAGVALACTAWVTRSREAAAAEEAACVISEAAEEATSDKSDAVLDI